MIESYKIADLSTVPDQSGTYTLFANLYWLVVNDCVLFTSAHVPLCSHTEQEVKNLVDNWVRMFDIDKTLKPDVVKIDKIWYSRY